jgi:hypothetical protein
MFPRTTDPSSINKPVIGNLNLDKEDKVDDIYDKYNFNFKKLLIPAILILLILIGTAYCTLFVLDLKMVPAKGIEVSEVKVLSNNVLSFQLKSNGFYIVGQSNYEIIGNEDGTVYFNVKEPFISKKLLPSQTSADSSYGEYQLDIKGIKVVYYKVNNSNDKVLIWQK